MKRLKNEYWIIKDVGRNTYSFYDKQKYYIIADENINLKTLGAIEKEKRSRKFMDNIL